MNESELYPYVTSDFSGRDCLVLAPHPDDESIGFGGSIVKHIRHGSRVKVVFLTSGDQGDFRGIYGNDYVGIRHKSAIEALSVLGVHDYEFWGYRDRGLYADEERIYGRLMEKIHEFSPQLIYAPSPYEAHPDHRVAAALAWKVHHAEGAHILFSEILTTLTPNVLVDISEEFVIKERAIGCYFTELKYNDYIDKIKGLNRFRTATLPDRITYAEAYLSLSAETRDHPAIKLVSRFMEIS